MQLKSIAKVTEATNLFNNIVSNGAVSNLALKNALEGLDVQTKINIVSQSALNETQKIGALASAGLTAEELKNTVQTGALSASQKAATTSTLGFGTAMKGLGISIKKTMVALASNPITWIAAGLVTLAGVLDLITTSTKEYEKELGKLRDNLDDVKAEYNEFESELKSCNDELKTTQERMKELESIESPTFAEKEEYDNLVATNNELERKIKLLELEQKAKNEEKNKAFVSTMKKDVNDGNEYWVDKYTGTVSKGDSIVARLGGFPLAVDATEADYIEQQFATRQALLDDLSEAETKKEQERIEGRIKEIDLYLQKKSSEWNKDSEGISYISNPTTEDEKAVNEWLDYIADFQDRMAIAMTEGDASSNAEVKQNTFNRIVDSLQFDETVQGLQDLGKEGKVTAEMLNDPKYDEFINKLVFLGVIDSADNLDEIALAFNSVAISAENAADTTGDYVDKDDNLFTQLTTSKEALDKFQSSVKSAADAYSTLLSGNYSSSDLLGSLQTINEAVSEMGGSINWEFIDSQSQLDSLNLLGDAIEHIAEKYAESVLSGAGIDVDSKFGQMLANNIIQAQKASTQLEVLDGQIDSLQSAYSDLTDIVGTYNETGYITFDQLQTLLELEPQYLACLIDENGQLQLNERAMTALANQRLNDAEAQAVQQAIAELGQIAFQDEQTAVENNGQAFQDQISKLEGYNQTLATTIAEASIGAGYIRDLNSAIEGAEARGASDDQIQTVLNNLEIKLQAISGVREKIANSGLGSVLGNSQSSTKDTAETFDWIEQAIENVEKDIKELDEIANSAYSTFSQKNEALAQEISKVSDEIDLQQQAYEEYMRKANSIPLSDHYRQLVQSGTINIEDISDKNLQDLISEYQNWYDKAQNVSDAIKELKTDMKDLYVSAYELQTDNLKNRLDSDSITQKQYLEGLKTAYEQFYANIEDFAEQYHEAILNYLAEEKDYLNSVAGAAASLIDSEIDKIEDDADAQEDIIQKQIALLEAKKKPLQDELDALEDKAKRENLILNLQKAQQELAKAENQRTKLVNYMPDTIVI